MSDSTLFIPDISGFTRFVKQTEIQHSQHIIEELINLIIKEGSHLFKVAEIEGDAVFFFKHEEKLSVEEVTSEARRIYRPFISICSTINTGEFAIAVPALPLLSWN